MKYEELREQVRRLASWSFVEEGAIKEYTNDIMTVIDSFLEDKAVEMKLEKFVQSSGYGKMGFNRGIDKAAQIIRSKE